MPEDRNIAGIRCTEILAELDDYIDDLLPEARKEQIEAHLHECQWCARFGGEYMHTIQNLQGILSDSTASVQQDSTVADFARSLIQNLDP